MKNLFKYDTHLSKEIADIRRLLTSTKKAVSNGNTLGAGGVNKPVPSSIESVGNIGSIVQKKIDDTISSIDLVGGGFLYRGEFSLTTKYYHTELRRDIVLGTDGNYWITNKLTLNGKEGSYWKDPVGDPNNWERFEGEFSSIATGLLLTADANITRTLTIGSDVTDGIIQSSESLTAPNNQGTYIFEGDGFFFGENQVASKAVMRIGTVDASGSLTNGFMWDKTNGAQFAGKVTITNPADVGNVTIRSNTAPLTRNDGSTLVDGDIWIDTDDGDKIYSWDGTNWIQGYTIIDGGNILSNTITATQIDVFNLFSQTIGVSGALYNGSSTYQDVSLGSLTTGFWLGYDSGAAKFQIINSDTKYFNYDGTDFELAGGTITGGTIQTSASGQRIVIDGSSNRITFYSSSGSVGYIDGSTISGLGDAILMFGNYHHSGEVWFGISSKLTITYGVLTFGDVTWGLDAGGNYWDFDTAYLRANRYYIGSTEVIDSSRNATFNEVRTDDIVFPSISVSGTSSTSQVVTVQLDQIGGTNISRNALLTFWFSTSNDPDIRDAGVGGWSFNTATENSGRVLPGSTISYTGLNHAITDGNGEFEFTISSGGGFERTIYIHCEFQGIVYTSGAILIKDRPA